MRLPRHIKPTKLHRCGVFLASRVYVGNNLTDTMFSALFTTAVRISRTAARPYPQALLPTPQETSRWAVAGGGGGSSSLSAVRGMGETGFDHCVA
jgi:hypothetical protein